MEAHTHACAHAKKRDRKRKPCTILNQEGEQTQLNLIALIGTAKQAGILENEYSISLRE